MRLGELCPVWVVPGLFYESEPEGGIQVRMNAVLSASHGLQCWAQRLQISLQMNGSLPGTKLIYSLASYSSGFAVTR